MTDYSKLSDAQLMAALNGGGSIQSMSDGDLMKAIGVDQHNNYDPTAGMSGYDKFMAGVGKGMHDVYMGGRQMLADVGFGDKSSIDSQINESKNIDAPLMRTGSGLAGNVLGSVAPAIPLMFVPGANTVAGAAGVGAIQSAFQPVSEGENRVANMATGAALGAGSNLIGKGIGAIATKANSALSPEESRLVQVAQNNGIPLRASQIKGSRPLAYVESVMEDLPSTSSGQLAQKSAQKQAFTRAVLSKAGINSDSATPDVLLSKKQALGNTFEDIAGRNQISFTNGILNDLNSIGNQASRRMSDSSPITNTIGDIIDDASNSNGLMPGTKYQGWRETLRLMSKGNDTQSHYAGQIKKVLDNAFTSQIGKVNPQDAMAWSSASRQYANLKTILNAMGSSGKDALSGDISPTQIGSALRQSMGKEGVALGRGDLNDLVRAGKMFVSENVPNSGTSQRKFFTDLLTGRVPGALVGAGIGYHETGNAEGAGLGALGGAALGYGLPKAIQSGMNSRIGQRVLTNGILPEMPRLQMLAQILRNPAVAAGAAVGIPELIQSSQ